MSGHTHSAAGPDGKEKDGVLRVLLQKAQTFYEKDGSSVQIFHEHKLVAPYSK